VRDAGSASSAHGRCVCAAAGAEGGARHQRSIASRIGTPPAAEAYSAHALSLKSASCSQHECTKAPLPARSQPPGRVTSATKRRENALRLAMASGVHVRRGGGRLARRAAAARTCERRESGVRGGVRAAQREAGCEQRSARLSGVGGGGRWFGSRLAARAVMEPIGCGGGAPGKAAIGAPRVTRVAGPWGGVRGVLRGAVLARHVAPGIATSPQVGELPRVHRRAKQEERRGRGGRLIALGLGLGLGLGWGWGLGLG
jgi:hypothetical protein